MILDSTFLVDVLRGTSDVSDLEADIDARGTAFASSITVMELYEGIHLTNASEAERSAVERLLNDLTELSFDRECAITAGRINAELVDEGNPVDETDVMIAATGLVHDQPIVTRNVDHFDRIQDLEVVTY